MSKASEHGFPPYWYGNRIEWDELPGEEKRLYEIVCMQDDVDVSTKIRPRICDRCGAPIKVCGDYCEYCGVAIK